MSSNKKIPNNSETNDTHDACFSDDSRSDKELWNVIERQQAIIQQLQLALNEMTMERDQLMDQLKKNSTLSIPTPPPRSPYRNNLQHDSPSSHTSKTTSPSESEEEEGQLLSSVTVKAKLFQQTSFTLSIIDKRSNVELWSVEKLYSEFLDLDATLKAHSSNNALLFYDKSFLFFNNKSVDSNKRKLAIEEYFEQVFQSNIQDDALFLFLLRKPHLYQSYLTKRTKFGWTRYFFVLTGSQLLCFDRHDSQLFVKIISLVPETQIGKQSSSTNVEESFRHAFVILNKGNNSILCAKSDKERDRWVKALLKAIKAQKQSRPMPIQKKSSEDSLSLQNSSHLSTATKMVQQHQQYHRQQNRRSFWSRKATQAEGPHDATHQIHQGGTLFPVFGVPLQAAIYTNTLDLPPIVHRCIEYLEARNVIYEEGIYRLSGSSLQISRLRQKFGDEGDVDLLQQDLDLHVVAGLLKCWFRELPDNILTNGLLADFVSILEYQDRPSRLKLLEKLIHQLPKANYHVLRALIAHLNHIAHNSDQNKMSLRNLSIVFAPTLSIPSGVFALLMAEHDFVFGRSAKESNHSSLVCPKPSTSADKIKLQYLKNVHIEQDEDEEDPYLQYQHRDPFTVTSMDLHRTKVLVSEHA
ncbi:hypothetical protein EDC96DRAFT_21214 [Choanephora cucurbitarum]|nr:hypothetical protein EDC96DRAFT_21214 [Choanephora cucurbitarum]